MADTSIIEQYYRDIIQVVDNNELDKFQKIIKITGIFTKINEEKNVVLTEWKARKDGFMWNYIFWIIITIVFLIGLLVLCYFRIKDMKRNTDKYNIFDYVLTILNITISYFIITCIMSIFINNISINLKYANGMIKMIDDDFKNYMTLIVGGDINLVNILFDFADKNAKSIDIKQDFEKHQDILFSMLNNFKEETWLNAPVFSEDNINVFIKIEKIINNFEKLVVNNTIDNDNINIDEIIERQLNVWKNDDQWVGGEAIVWLNGFDGESKAENIEYVYERCKYVYDRRKEDRLFTKDWWLSDLMLGKYIKDGDISMVFFDKWWLNVMMVVKEKIDDIEEGIVNKIGLLLCKYNKSNSHVNDPIVAKAIDLKTRNQIKNCKNEEGFDEFLEKWSRIKDPSVLKINDLSVLMNNYHRSVTASLKSNNQKNILWQKSKDNTMFNYIMGVVIVIVVLLLITILSTLIRYYINNTKNKDFIIVIIIVFFTGLLVISLLSSWINKKNAIYKHNIRVLKNNTQILSDNIKSLANLDLKKNPRYVYVYMRNVVNSFKKYNYIILGVNQEVPFPYTDIITYSIIIMFIIGVLVYSYLYLKPFDKLKKIRENMIKKELLSSASAADLDRFKPEIDQEFICEMQSSDETMWVVKITMSVLTIMFIIITIIKLVTSSVNYDSGLRNSRYYKEGIPV